MEGEKDTMKNLTRFLTILLILALLLPVCAVAEESLPYMQQLTQNTYSSTAVLTTESYPEVCLTPYYFSSVFISEYKQPYFMHFPCPPNTFVADFEDDSVSFLDLENNYQYMYQALESYAYETFLNGCDVDEYILADGSDALAIYIEPDRYRAYALIGVPEIEKSTKLAVTFIGDSLRGRDEQVIIDALTEQITNEVARIKASLTVELADSYWTDGRYAGFNIISTNSTVGYGMTYTLPEGYVVTKLDDRDVSIAKVLGKNDALQVDFDIDTYSYVSYQVDEKPEDVITVTIDGAEYRIYTNWYNDEKIMSAYVDRVLSNAAGYSNDQPLYLTLHLDPDGSFEWTNTDALVADLKTIVAGVQITENLSNPDFRDATPYASAPAPAAQDAPAADEGWACPSCGETVTTNFCPNDGTAKPEEAAA